LLIAREFKCGNITDINNYRAIALCNVESKILKKSFFLKFCHAVNMISISLALNGNIQLGFVLILLSSPLSITLVEKAMFLPAVLTFLRPSTR